MTKTTYLKKGTCLTVGLSGMLDSTASLSLEEEAIDGILRSGGIPMLAHPAFGNGAELITGEELDRRVRCLIGFGLRGLEAFYSGFTPRLRAEVLTLAEKYGLLVTAGSDYHGKNKLVMLGDTKLDPSGSLPEGLRRFLEETGCGV